ncbi:GNAT family N-acetyltransferase [Acidiphilium iwatense]|uniref:GNAT family N-acetyltransferase n=1 Tax=Acidiphilium iwatense TaxID=768198 RepID=A0ABS9DV75_9PROT|nr:GNAT family N-acetyltransferase [Acidiphilium iwatense]MCF3945254.1 GNAT family N-acetyltransferase [Acidiphilium iwatense]
MTENGTTEDSPMLVADPVRPEETGLLLDMARTFHSEDGHPMDAAAEAATRASVTGEGHAALAPTWLLRHEGRVVGYFVLSLGYSPEHGGLDAFIDDIFLVPDIRGRGLGRAALGCAVESARARGARVLMLEVEKHNDRAYRLYASEGFVDTGRRLMYRHL